MGTSGSGINLLQPAVAVALFRVTGNPGQGRIEMLLMPAGGGRPHCLPEYWMLEGDTPESCMRRAVQDTAGIADPHYLHVRSEVAGNPRRLLMTYTAIVPEGKEVTPEAGRSFVHIWSQMGHITYGRQGNVISREDILPEHQAPMLEALYALMSAVYDNGCFTPFIHGTVPFKKGEIARLRKALYGADPILEGR